MNKWLRKWIGARAGKRAYASARIDRLTADWVFSKWSADKEIESALEVVRARCRSLERDNDFARRYLQMVEANVVGRTFRLRLPDMDVAGKFHAWLDVADVSGRLSGGDLQRQIVRTVARDGECLLLLTRGNADADGLNVQVVESDYLDHTYNEDLPNGRGFIRMGVELDAQMRPVAYHVFDRHPGETGGASKGPRRRIPASDLIHVYRAERPGQNRGMPWMQSVVMTLRMLHGYMEAELVASRTAACKMGFFTVPPGDDFQNDGTDALDRPVTDAAPGTFQTLKSGQTFTSFDPQHPTAQFGAFVKAVLRQAAGGLNVAYNNFANDLDGVSYSSIRSGTIEEREQWIVLQDWFARAALRPLFAAWLEMAEVSGTVTVAQAASCYGRDQWVGRRWQWVDPRADLDAKAQEIALGLTAPSTLAAEGGVDYAEVQAQIAKDEALRKSLNLPPVVAQPAEKVDTGAPQ